MTQLTPAAVTLPASYYRDPAIYERERHAIFARSWLLVARSAQLSQPGHYVATTIAGWPIIVVVGDDGRLRAFHNVCRHRAGPLAWDGDGHCPSLVCRYHGWAYDLRGRLSSARDFGEADDFDPAEISLVPALAESWRGLVFVNLWGKGPSLHESLGGFAPECDEFPMEEFHFTREVVHEVAANWKAYADNYLEGYHIPLVHRGLNREIDAKRYEVLVGDGWCRHSAPARDGSMLTGRWLWCWPNWALNVYPDGMNVERFLPAGPSRTRVVYQYFFRDAANEESIRMSAELMDEDREICEAVQRNLESGSYDTGRLSPRHERALATFQHRVRTALDSQL